MWNELRQSHENMKKNEIFRRFDGKLQKLNNEYRNFMVMNERYDKVMDWQKVWNELWCIGFDHHKESYLKISARLEQLSSSDFGQKVSPD